MNRRSDKLDRFIGYDVDITFIDGQTEAGVFGWEGPPVSRYYIAERCEDECIIKSFRKSAVLTIERAAPSVKVVINCGCDSQPDIAQINKQLASLGIDVISIEIHT